jgi:hypothetical protein
MTVAKAAGPSHPILRGKTYVSENHGNGHTGNIAGKVYDAQTYLQVKLKVRPNGTLKVYHRTPQKWGTPGHRVTVDIGRAFGFFGHAFYTSTVQSPPSKNVPSYEVDVELPMKAFAGKKVLELPARSPDEEGRMDDTYIYGGVFKMPPGVDIIVVPNKGVDGKETWVIFKDGSEAWLNESATKLDFEARSKTGEFSEGGSRKSPNSSYGWPTPN